MSNKCGDPYENLANAIIVQAAEDYRRALKALKRRGRDRDALAVKEECERFFQSGWFSVLIVSDKTNGVLLPNNTGAKGTQEFMESRKVLSFTILR